MKKLIFFVLIFFVCSLNIDALCYDNSLNEWALNTNIKFIDFNRNLINEETNEPLYKTMDYSYIKFNQMYHRIYRIGQKELVNIDILIYKGTIEQNIWSAVKGKHTLSTLFFSIHN